MQTKVLGSGNQGSIAPAEWAVDPMFLAGRIALRPMDYTGAGRVLGHYRVAPSTSSLAVLVANGVLATMRWSDPGSFFVLLRASVGVSVQVALPAAQRTDPIVISHARAYTVNETTSITAVSLTGNNQKLRTTPMGSSLVAQMAVASAAAGITGGTKTLDALPFGQASISPALLAIGSGCPVTDLYAAMTVGGHPPVYAANEGFAVSWGSTAIVTPGAVTANMIFEWAEVIVY